MKQVIFISSLILFLGSCSRNSDPVNNNATNAANTVTSGTWRVSLFSERGIDETSDFNGIQFSFNSNGVLNTSGAIAQVGSWSVSSSSNKFNIDLGPKIDANKPLGELTDDWFIISVSATELKLTDDNATREEFLTFTKN